MVEENDLTWTDKEALVLSYWGELDEWSDLFVFQFTALISLFSPFTSFTERY